MDVVTRRDGRRDVMMVGPFARQISSDVASCILLQVACHTHAHDNCELCTGTR